MINAIQWVGTPRLSWSFVAIEDLDHWEPFFTYIRQRHAPRADYSVGGRGYAVFVHDWRTENPLMWLRKMADRELTTAATDDQDQRESRKPIVVISHPEFVAAVRQALHDYARPDMLAGNPLLSSRLVSDGVPDQSPTQTLRLLLRLSAEELNTHPRDQRLYRALYRTFFNPAATQEQAAELLGIPFSTYRTHLREGIKRVAELLWQTGAVWIRGCDQRRRQNQTINEQFSTWKPNISRP
jgi:DNA-directed RNA polymerase specialized sigma24 family protein